MAKKKTPTRKKAQQKKATADVDGFALPSPPKRSRPAKAKADAFVAQKNLRREVPGERLTVYLPPPVAEELRVRCARERSSLSQAVTDAVVHWLGQ